MADRWHPAGDPTGTVRLDPDAPDPCDPAALRAINTGIRSDHPWILLGPPAQLLDSDLWLTNDDVRGWPIQPLPVLAEVFGHRDST